MPTTTDQRFNRANLMRRSTKYQAPTSGSPWRRRISLWKAALLCLLISGSAASAGHAVGGEGPPEISVQTAWQRPLDAPADTVFLIVELTVPEGYHINADTGQLRVSPDFSPVPTSLQIVNASRGLTSGAPLFPAAVPMAVSFSEHPIMLFDGRVTIRVPITVSPSAISPFTVDLTLLYQACDERACFFPTQKPLRSVVDTLPAAMTTSPATNAPPGTRMQYQLFGFNHHLDPSRLLGKILLLVMAFFGGVLLNLTPCVLPLIPIKLISLASAAETARRRSLVLAGAMSLGIVGFWGGLGLLVSLFSSIVTANQLFQYPWFTIFIGAVIGVMAVGLMWAPQLPMPAFLNHVNLQQHRLGGSFGIGVLTAVLSTPCTAPLMGTAMAWAVSQAPATALMAFVAIGLGMASPYVVLTIWPAGVSRLPKSGPGSVLMKQVIALLLMAAASYFIGTGVSGLLVTPPEPPAKTYWWAVSACIAAAGGWLALQCRRIDPSRLRCRMWIAGGVATAVLALFMGRHFTGEEPVRWTYYTPVRYAQAIAANKPVVIVFTAEWCLNCKAIEQQVYRHAAVVEMFSEGRAIPMKVDLTAPNPDGRAFLRSLGQIGIPLVAVWSSRGRFTFVSDFYSAEQLLAAVEQAVIP